MAQVTTTFPDQTYTSSNKPSADTLKADISAIETAANETDTNAVRKDGTVGLEANVAQSATPSAATHLATMGAIYPVGGVFVAVVATNPATLLGFGTWSRIAEGQMLVGQKDADGDFDTAEETGGAKTVTLEEANLATHSHTADPANTSVTINEKTGLTGTVSLFTKDSRGLVDDNLPNGIMSGSNSLSGYARPDENFSSPSDSYAGFSINANHSHSGSVNIASFNTGNTGSGTAVDILNPYFVIYAWKRTA